MPTNAPKAAKPSKQIFDPFNSSATGHQRAENRLSGSTLWRDSRHRKLREQFSSDAGGGKRMSDTVGAGGDGSVKMGLTEAGKVTWFRSKEQLSLQETMKVIKDVERPTKRRKVADPISDFDSQTPIKTEVKAAAAAAVSPDSSPSQFLSPVDANSFPPNTPLATTTTTPPLDPNPGSQAKEPSTNQDLPPQLFTNTTIYINGSTTPKISGHRLKRLLTEHGANISIALGRRKVTHVILGRSNNYGGAGGGLAGSKIQKEISAKRGESVKYVTVEWVLESIKAGKRLPEWKYEAVRLAPKGVGCVVSMLRSSKDEKG